MSSLSSPGVIADEIRVGDIVATGPNPLARFEVLAVHGDKAWVRNTLTAADHLAFLCRCRTAETAPRAEAAE